MYIIAIGWLYVTVLMAASEETLLAGITTFLFYGLLPCSILMYLMGTPARHRAIKAREAAELAAMQAAAAETGQSSAPDAGHSEPAAQTGQSAEHQADGDSSSATDAAMSHPAAAPHLPTTQSKN